MDFLSTLKGTGSSFADIMQKNGNLIGSVANPVASGGTSFLDGLKNLGSSFSNWLGQENNANSITNFDKLGGVLGGVGALYGAYNNQKMAKKNFKLQEDAYNFNKYLANQELQRRANMEQKLQDVWSN